MSEADPGEQPAQWPDGWPVIPESVTAVIDAARVNVGPGPAGALAEAGDSLPGADLVVEAAKLVVAAWVAAVNGDDSALLDISDDEPEDDAERTAADVVHYLLNPVRKDWVIAPGPEVTSIDLWLLDLSGDVPEMSVQWRFTGSQRHAGPVVPPGWTGSGEGEYVGLAHLAFHGSQPFPWRMTRGHVRTVDEFYGYTYTIRDETPGEYRSRTGTAVSAAALVPGGTYRLLASYAESDHKFSGQATSDVDSDVSLTREEAQRLAEGAIDADAQRRIASIYPNDRGEIEARPYLILLEAIRLLDLAPPVAPATSPTGPDLEEFAQRYGASRGLTPDDRAPAWRDPGPWFLATTDITRSRGLLRGPLGGGPFGEFWYAEGAVHGLGRSREQWAVARYESMQARRAGGIACIPRQWPRQVGTLPRGLLAIATGDDAFDKLFVVGAAGGEPVTSGPSWAQRTFPAELTAWLLAQPYGEEGADATGFQVQGGLMCVYSRGWPATAESLDAFCDRAAKIAAAIEEATRFVVR